MFLVSFIRRSLHLRLLCYSITLIILSVTTVTVLDAIKEKDQIRDGLKNQAETILNIVAGTAGNSLASDDIKCTKRILMTLSEQKKIINSARLYSPTGHLVTDFFSENTDTADELSLSALEVLESKEVSFTWEQNSLIASKSIWKDTRPLGVIEIGIKTDILNAQISELTVKTAGGILFSLVFCLILYYMFANSIVEPIKALSSGVKRISEGDLTHPVEAGVSDEIGDVIGTINHMQSSIKDILDKLHETEERYTLAEKGTNEGMWDYHLDKNMVYYSSRWFDIIDLPQSSDINSFADWEGRIVNEDRSVFSDEFSKFIKSNDESFEVEYRMTKESGDICWVRTRGYAVRDDAGECTRVVGSHSDITHNKCREVELTKSAYYDPLTELPNRRLLMDRLDYCLHKAERNIDFIFGVLYLDFDGFKLVNDTFGHNIGDRLLVDIARRLQACLRPSDSICRVGGDEFVILVDDVQSEAMVLGMADRILKVVDSTFIIEQHSIPMSVSIGVTCNYYTVSSASQMIEDADAAMYHAKISGKNQICTFDLSMRYHQEEKWKLENELHLAIEQNELELHFQPLIAATDLRIYGFESLIRWEHSERGVIPPGEFLPAAEETGYITDITRWVINSVCQQVVMLNELVPQDLVIFVNVSAKDFFVPGGLVGTLKYAMELNNCIPLNIGIEITERTLVQNYESIRAQLNEIRSMGVNIKLDDFGTGCSSLNYLHRFPLDGIKIDTSFIRAMSQDETSCNLVRALIGMAHHLNLNVVAEGVETPEELEFLIDNECDYIQGFLCGQGLTISKCVDFITTYDKELDIPRTPSPRLIDDDSHLTSSDKGSTRGNVPPFNRHRPTDRI